MRNKTQLHVVTPYIKQDRFKIAINKDKYLSLYDSLYDIKQLKFKHNKDNLIGTIKEKNNNRIIIAWKDGSIERFQSDILEKCINNYDISVYNNNTLIKSSTIKNILFNKNSSITGQNNKINTNSIKQSTAKNTSVNNQNKHENPIKLIESNNILNEAKEIVNLALSKGMIDESDFELELLKIEAFDKDTFEQYKNEVLNFSINGEVSSSIEENTNLDGLTKEEIEAQNMLNTLRKERGIFKSKNTIDIKNAETRSLKDTKYDNNNIFRDISFANTNNGTNFNAKPPTLEESLENIINDNLPVNNTSRKLKKIQAIKHANDHYNNSFNNLNNDFNDDLYNDFNDNYNNNSNSTEEFSLDEIITNLNNESNMKKTSQLSAGQKSFLSMPLSGITKPLILGSDNEGINSINNAYKELFSEDMWSIGKR